MNDPIERAVRDHLDREAARVDAAAMLARVRKPNEPMTRRAWLRYGAGIGGAALAAGIGGLLFFSPTQPPQLAAAEQIVREAKEAHALASDRLYDTILGEFACDVCMNMYLCMYECKCQTMKGAKYK